MGRVRRVEDQKEMEKSVDEFAVRDYKIKSRGETSVRMQKKDWGDSVTHLIIAGLTIWWTFGLANALYAIHQRVTAEEIVIQIEKEHENE